MLVSGSERFATDDLLRLVELVDHAWMRAASLDWSVPAGELEWSCLRTADHAVDCVYAPAYFLASRRTDAYPEVGSDLTLGDGASPALLVESLWIAARMLVGVVHDAPEDCRAVIFQRPEPVLGAPPDFVPRAALELIVHAHDVCAGLGVPFEPRADIAHRLREHTRPWPMWDIVWDGLPDTDDPWADLLAGSGRRRAG